jgi:hypothetical protein
MIGVFLDRLPKKTVMVWVDLIRTVMTFLIPALFALDLLSLEGLYVLIFLTSIVSTIFGPALVSTVPRLVHASELVTANALIQGTNNIGLLLGPAISGVLIAMMGAENVLYVNSATFLISAFCLIPMRFHETLNTGKEAGNISASVLDDLKVGFRFVFGTQSKVFVLVIISALYNLSASAFVFILPVYAKEFLQVGPVQLGWLWSSLGVGMLAVSTWLAWRASGLQSQFPRNTVDRRCGGHCCRRQHGSHESRCVGVTAGGHSGTLNGTRTHDVQHGIDGRRHGGHDRLWVDRRRRRPGAKPYRTWSGSVTDRSRRDPIHASNGHDRTGGGLDFASDRPPQSFWPPPSVPAPSR